MTDSVDISGSEPDENISLILGQLRTGDPDALARLLPLVYRELRRLAAHYMQQERSDHTLQPTALVHEAYLRLIGQTDREWQNRGHFFAVAAHAMRNVLVDHARANLAQKRGGGQMLINLSEAELAVGFPDPRRFLTLNEVLTKLEAIDERASKVVELRWFVGHSVEEAARALGVSEKTVRRDWDFAKAWIKAELESLE